MVDGRGNHPWSRITAVGLWCILAVALLRNPPVNILNWDTFGYYLYLPATILHQDPSIQDISWVEEARATYNSSSTLYRAQEQPSGGWVLKYPMGMALLWLPFFICGHVGAIITGSPLDGFSDPYQWALIMGLLSYVLVGLLLLARVLRTFFPEDVSAGVLALVVMGTNYVHQVFYSTGMPHVFLFTLYAGVLWHSVQWHRDHRWADAWKLAVLLALLALSRPSELVAIVIPVLTGLPGWSHWREHVAGLWRRRKQIASALLIALFIGSLQLLYWKWLTGRFLYMSYNNPGEGFEFLHPYTWEVLFSFRKGWYIYTPIMAVATAGILLLRRHLPALRWSIGVFFLLNLFVVSSWSCWWYADSFGQRALVQSYAVMALPLGAVLVWLRGRKLWWSIPGVAVLLGLTAFNLFQVRQSALGLIHTSRMTWPAYKAVLGTLERPEGLEELWSVERSYSDDQGMPELGRYRSRPLRALTFEAPLIGVSDTGRVPVDGGRAGHAWELGHGREFSPTITIPWHSLTSADHVWFKVSCEVLSKPSEPLPRVALCAKFEHNGHAYGYRAKEFDAAMRDSSGRSEISFWYMSPEVRRPTDPLVVYVWLMDSIPAVVDNIQVTLLEPRSP